MTGLLVDQSVWNSDGLVTGTGSISDLFLMMSESEIVIVIYVQNQEYGVCIHS